MDQAGFLKLLDKASEEGVFPYPEHERMDYAGMRVHAYKGAKDFALLFEMIMFDHESHRIECFHGFANHVFLFQASGKRLVWDDSALPIPIERVKGTPSVSLTEDADDDDFIANRKERQALNPAATVIAVRKKKVPVPQSASAYRDKGIKPSKPIALIDLLRYLVATQRDDVFSTDKEREKLLPRMKKLLTLDKWRHYTLDDEAPSQTEAYQMLADVLVTGDVTRYAPKQKPNT